MAVWCRCGIVALCMAAQLLDTPASADIILQEALRCKFSTKGEIFSGLLA